MCICVCFRVIPVVMSDIFGIINDLCVMSKIPESSKLLSSLFVLRQD